MADVFSLPISWQLAFDFVLMVYTLQVLPKDLRPPAFEKIAEFVKTKGTLLVITRGRDEADDPGKMPWPPLVRDELREFRKVGLTEVNFEDYLDNEDPTVRRFRVEYHRSS